MYLILSTTYEKCICVEVCTDKKFLYISMKKRNEKNNNIQNKAETNMTNKTQNKIFTHKHTGTCKNKDKQNSTKKSLAW